MTTRAEFIAEARSWIDTPYHHQARVKGAGVDCVGLPLETARHFGLTDFSTEAYSTYPDGESLLALCRTHLSPIPKLAIAPGDVVLIRFQRNPHHLALVGDYLYGGLSLIHADSTLGRVVEHRLDEVWRRLIVAAFAVPGLY